MNSGTPGKTRTRPRNRAILNSSTSIILPIPQACDGITQIADEIQEDNFSPQSCRGDPANSRAEILQDLRSLSAFLRANGRLFAFVDRLLTIAHVLVKVRERVFSLIFDAA